MTQAENGNALQALANSIRGWFQGNIFSPSEAVTNQPAQPNTTQTPHESLAGPRISSQRRAMTKAEGAVPEIPVPPAPAHITTPIDTHGVTEDEEFEKSRDSARRVLDELNRRHEDPPKQQDQEK